MSSIITLKPCRNQGWDPGVVLGLETIPNHYLSYIIASTIVAVTSCDNIENYDEANGDNMSRTELGYHSNMVVIGSRKVISFQLLDHLIGY